ncbi:MalY/PatB family protein [Ferrimonas balearica]|uniref:MalY/PatB family protein n=1 Tax=Ferrimonas balearica TaxID=44012 RepID=UPI001C994D9E|nr:PatB family C-S lyase [Ferrimonas balearica]MBY5991347.1 PatB family C-S lyase [Ferrimonas balearica]
MRPFDTPLSRDNNRFIKHDPKMLTQLYGRDDVTPYWVADMDFAVAPAITDELKRLVERGVYAYEFDSQGLYRAISDWYLKRHNLALATDGFAQVPGVLSGLAMLVNRFSEPGEGVLIQTPAYHQFAKLIRSNGREVVENPLRFEGGAYRLDLADFEAKLASGTVKIVLLCNPHNPTGRVWREEELKALMAIAERYKVLVVSDEVHADILLDGHRFTSAVGLGYDNVIALLGSPAKTFGMHSIATGFIYSPRAELIEAVKTQVDALYLGHGNALTTFATQAAYQHGRPWLDAMLAYLQETVDWVQAFLDEAVPEVTLVRPEGTYQVWLEMSALGLTPEQLKVLYAEAGVGLTPGNWFGGDYGQFVRMNIASPRAQIQDSLRALKAAIDNRDAITKGCSAPQSAGNGCC